MSPKQVKRLPKECTEKNGLYWTENYYYEPYTNIYGEQVYVKYKRTLNK